MQDQQNIGCRPNMKITYHVSSARRSKCFDMLGKRSFHPTRIPSLMPSNPSMPKPWCLLRVNSGNRTLLQPQMPYRNQDKVLLSQFFWLLRSCVAYPSRDLPATSHSPSSYFRCSPPWLLAIAQMRIKSSFRLNNVYVPRTLTRNRAA